MILKNFHLIKLSMILMVIAGIFLGAHYSFAVNVFTLDKALEIAMSNSPDIKKTELDLERTRESLNAQNAALKSQFSLSFNPFTYSSDRTFFRIFSIWNTSESKESNSTFTISQPLKWTDGTLSLLLPALRTMATTRATDRSSRSTSS